MVGWVCCDVHFCFAFNVELSIAVPFPTPSEALTVGGGAFGRRHLGTAIWAPPFGRRRLGARQLGAEPFGHRTFGRRFELRRKNNEAGNSLNAVKREPVPARVLNPNAS